MDCWSRFGMRVLLTCPRYAERRPGALSELERVGLDPVELENPYIGGWRGLEFAHRAAWTRFLESGANTLLVVEDDARFVMDLRLLQATVDALPRAFDEARFCWGGARGDARKARRSRWAPVTGNRRTCYMTACYALSRRAARERLEISDSILAGKVPFVGVDLRLGMHGQDFVALVSVPPVAIVSGADGASGESARKALLLDASVFGMGAEDYAV